MPDSSKDFLIGVLAERSGVHIETIRYYERIGLMPAPARSSGGHRLYDRDHLRPTIRRQQHDPGALDVFVPPISIGNDRLQTSTIIAAKQNANCLGHGEAIASLVG
ncbi:MAG: MerR family DNA-binding transcriptional regulator [Rhizobiales bacterium]|nr:MerR family DNA-binding transcriptional regulator [Hyphomicrobiales bacterium]